MNSVQEIKSIINSMHNEQREHTFHAFGDTYLKYRKVVAEWMIDVCDYFALHLTTTHIALAYLDRLQPNEKFTRFEWQMLAICCILIASKYNESEENVPQRHSMKEITQQNITNEMILNYELWALKRMGWKLNARVPSVFLDSYIAAGGGLPSNLQSDSELSSVFHARIHYLSTLTILDSTFKRFLSSDLACAILFVTRRDLGFPHAWTAELTTLTFTDAMSSSIREVVRLIDSHTVTTPNPPTRLSSISATSSFTTPSHPTTISPASQSPQPTLTTHSTTFTTSKVEKSSSSTLRDSTISSQNNLNHRYQQPMADEGEIGQEDDENESFHSEFEDEGFEYEYNGEGGEEDEEDEDDDGDEEEEEEEEENAHQKVDYDSSFYQYENEKSEIEDYDEDESTSRLVAQTSQISLNRTNPTLPFGSSIPISSSKTSTKPLPPYQSHSNLQLQKSAPVSQSYTHVSDGTTSSSEIPRVTTPPPSNLSSNYFFEPQLKVPILNQQVHRSSSHHSNPQYQSQSRQVQHPQQQYSIQAHTQFNQQTSLSMSTSTAPSYYSQNTQYLQQLQQLQYHQQPAHISTIIPTSSPSTVSAPLPSSLSTTSMKTPLQLMTVGTGKSDSGSTFISPISIANFDSINSP